MESDHVITVWQEIRGHLEARKAQIYEEIRRYPPPIPACDVQFNTLLEKRTDISRELGRMARSRNRHSPLG